MSTSNLDYDKLRNDAIEAASDLLAESALCVYALVTPDDGIQAKPLAVEHVLKQYPVLVACHALICFLDARYQESVHMKEANELSSGNHE